MKRVETGVSWTGSQQVTLREYEADQAELPRVDRVYRDNAVPEPTRPLPDPEAERVPWRERLRSCGFSPSCIREADGITQIHVERGLHPDDEHRESHYPPAGEEAIGADLQQQAWLNDLPTSICFTVSGQQIRTHDRIVTTGADFQEATRELVDSYFPAVIANGWSLSDQLEKDWFKRDGPTREEEPLSDEWITARWRAASGPVDGNQDSPPVG